MMSRPLIVIHGVSNHTPERFDAEVDTLAQTLGNEWRLIKVFWGDLGARTGVDYAPVIPSLRGTRATAGEDGTGVDPDLAAALLPATVTGGVRATDARVELMVSAATGGAVRADDDPEVNDTIAAAIRDETAQTTYLSRIDNAAVLDAVGRSVGDATRRAVAASGGPTSGGPTSGGPVHGEQAGGFRSPGAGRAGPGGGSGGFGWTVSEPDVANRDETRLGFGSLVHGTGRTVGKLAREADQIARGLLHDADRIVGSVLGQVAGSLNEAIRNGFVADALGFIGDIFVYEHLRPLVQNRIWQAIEADPELSGGGWGRDPGHRVHLAGHSLGGVIAFHAATAADSGSKLYLDSLVTFGSQAPMFHLMDPVESGLAAYQPGRPVSVGDGIRRWTNLWEPMDPLAFIAARVFHLGTAAQPVAPTDVAVAHLASYGLWTHSAYWHAPELPEAITATMT